MYEFNREPVACKEEREDGEYWKSPIFKERTEEMSEVQVSKIQKQRDRRKVRMKVSQTSNVGFQDFRKKKGEGVKCQVS